MSTLVCSFVDRSERNSLSLVACFFLFLCFSFAMASISLCCFLVCWNYWEFYLGVWFILQIYSLFRSNFDGLIVAFYYRLYYTKVQLGSPPKEFYVQIDTGSDVLWVSCNSCNGCPTTSGLQVLPFLIHIHCFIWFLSPLVLLKQ